MQAHLLCSAALMAAWNAPVLAQTKVALPTGSANRLSSEAEVPPPNSIEIPLPGDDSAATGAEIGEPQIPLGPHGRPDINPYDRDIEMTVPLTYLNKTLGEIPMLMTADDQIFLDTSPFLELMYPVLTTDAASGLQGRLDTLDRFAPSDLFGSGVGLTYDPSSLSVVVVDIAPENRATVNLFAPPREDADQATIEPEYFSAFLNLSLSQAYIWESGDKPPPTFNFDGAIRMGRIVFEGDAQLGERFSANGDTYSLSRNYARLVYDQPERYRRFFLGDLDPEIRGQQAFVSMGGIGVLRQQRRFNAFRSAILQPNRELIVQRESTVRFLRNGALYRELRLQPGRYDFSQLPLVAGSNDINIQVSDNSGAVQNLSYQQYLDPIDLDPGDFEYGAYFGPTSDTFAGAPDYGGPIAFTGFFRKAFYNRPAVGLGIQASSEVQTLTGQTQFVLGNGGRLLLDGGASNGKFAGQGFAAGVGYDHFFDRDALSDSLTIRADYTSEKFSTLGNVEGINSTEFALSAQYTRQFDLRLLTTTSASYIKGRSALGDSYRFGSTAYYRLDQRWTLRAGVEYARFSNLNTASNGFSVSVGIVFQPSYRKRAEARYESRNNLAELSYNQSGLNQLNSLGFGGILSRQDGSVLGQGYMAYSANRFDATASHATYGPNLSGFGSTNVTSVRVGTTIAMAGDTVGVGRRINDSFVLLKPHENLEGHDVVAGQSLAGNNYISRSGALGAAVNNYLGSYSMQSVQYDVEEPPLGYDTGSGVLRVFPSYKSGYAARIGTDAFVTAMGTLILSEGRPVPLVGGRVKLLDLSDDDDPEPIAFFTNSVGRFAIPNLLPGRRYLVETYGPGGTIGLRFEFSVPADTDGLVKLGTVRPNSTHQEDAHVAPADLSLSSIIRDTTSRRTKLNLGGRFRCEL